MKRKFDHNAGRNHRSPRHARGSILILVVAVLALLAVMGTAFIVSARVYRGATRGGSTTVNMDFAVDASLQVVRNTILTASLDSTGHVLGTDASGTSLVSARYYDVPEAKNGKSAGDTTVPDEPWLASGNMGPVWIPQPASAPVLQYNVGDVVSYKGVLYVCIKQHNAPATSTSSPSADTTDWQPVAPTTYTYSQLRPKAYDPGTNAEDIAANTPAWVVQQQNVTNDIPADGIQYLLPFSSSDGTRYRYAVRIIDSNGMANLNSGNNDSAQDDTSGQFLTAYQLFSPYICREVPPPPPAIKTKYLYKNSVATPNGLQGSSGNPFAPSTWQTTMFQFEKPTDPGLQFFDLSDELELRSFGVNGTPLISRPGRLWPVTLGNGYTDGLLHISRGSYTTNSWDRNVSPLVAAPLTVSIGGAAASSPWHAHQIVPVTPALANVDQLASLVTNLATAMKTSGYSDDEARAFAVNYVAFRYSNGFVDVPKADPTTFIVSVPTNQYLPYIDSTGLNILDNGGAVHNYGIGLASGTNVYVGYAAQPFISEVAAAGPGSAPTDCAIELYNPYPIPIYLNGWTLTSTDGTTITDLSKLIPRILPGGYAVLTQLTAGPLHTDANTNNPGLATAQPPQLADTTTNPANGTLVMSKGTGVFTLSRPYTTPGGVLATIPVDAFKYDFTTSVAGTQVSFQRSAVNPAGGAVVAGNPIWQYTVPVAPADATTMQTGDTLGVVNVTTQVATIYGVPLYDRFAVAASPPQFNPPDPFKTIADFNQIARITNWSNASNPGPITAIIGKFGTGLSDVPPPLTNPLLSFAAEPFDALVHFDFLYDHHAAPNASYVTAAGKMAIIPRAPTLMDFINMTDRASDSTIDIGGGNNDPNKIRLPGRINVNTASGRVLSGIPNMTDQMVANIVAYRTVNSTPTRMPATAYVNYSGVSTPSADYSNPNAYPPTAGIRSLGDLLNPLATPLPTGVTSLDARDRGSQWDKIINLCTVRSDTFVVYGYMEALRTNPNQGHPAHNNGTDWYTGTVSDDPTNTTAQMIRLSRRRFIALMDRSLCNGDQGTPTFQQPTITAFKDLGN